MTTNLVCIKEDGTLSDDVYILIGPYSLESPTRTYADLVKFLKLVKGVKGNILFFADAAGTVPFTEDLYDSQKMQFVNGDLYFTASQ